MAWPYVSATATITSGQSLSGAVGLGGRLLGALVMPSGWTTAVLTFQASDDGTTFRNVYDEFGNEYTVQAAVDRHILLDPSKFSGCDAIKIRSGTSGAAVNQGADRSIKLQMRDIT